MFIWGKSLPMATDDFQAIGVYLDNVPFGRHLSLFVWSSRGWIDHKTPGPLFGEPLVHGGLLTLSNMAQTFWQTSLAMSPGESMVIFVRPQRRTLLWRIAPLEIDASIVDRRGQYIRSVCG